MNQMFGMSGASAKHYVFTAWRTVVTGTKETFLYKMDRNKRTYSAVSGSHNTSSWSIVYLFLTCDQSVINIVNYNHSIDNI